MPRKKNKNSKKGGAKAAAAAAPVAASTAVPLSTPTPPPTPVLRQKQPDAGGDNKKGGRRRCVQLDSAAQLVEKMLVSRPEDKAEPSGVAPAIASAARKLERSIVSDSLNAALYARTELDELPESIKPDTHVAPALQSMQRKLQHQMTTDAVAQLFSRRSEMDDLIKKEIVADPTYVAPAIQSSQKSLQAQLNRSNLYHALSRRPSVVELVNAGLYVPRNEEDLEAIYDQFDEDYEPSLGSDAVDEADLYDEYHEYFEGDSGDGEEGHYSYTEGGPEDHSSEDGYAVQEENAPYASYDEGRSYAFHLTRLLLKTVAGMGRAGECDAVEKGSLKDLIVDQDDSVMNLAEDFLETDDFVSFKTALLDLV